MSTTAGRELDVMIAEHVLGHQVIQQRKGALKERTRQGHLRPLRHYSTDMSAAWEIVDKFGITLIPVHGGEWFSLVGNEERWGSPADFMRYLQTADFLKGGAAVDKSPSLSVCIAALRAVEKRTAVASVSESTTQH